MQLLGMLSTLPVAELCINRATRLVLMTMLYTPFASRFIMEKVDLVIVGAEGVAESGGIINKVPMCV